MLLGDDGWFIMKVLLLLVLLTVSGCERIRVVGQTGQNVTLNCTYDIKKEGASHACWNKGEIPATGGCNNKLISTDGYKVIKKTRVSSRYQLLGRLDEGDVSLTILNLTEEDAGLYGCRVEIPGWFNDLKHQFELKVEKAPDLSTSAPSGTLTQTQRTDASQTTDLMTTDNLLTPYTNSSNTAELQQKGNMLTVVLVCVLFFLVVLVTIIGLFIMARRWGQLKLTLQQRRQPDQFTSTSSTLQLHHRGSAIENIYQIDGGPEGGDYEVCP